MYPSRSRAKPLAPSPYGHGSVARLQRKLLYQPNTMTKPPTDLLRAIGGLILLPSRPHVPPSHIRIAPLAPLQACAALRLPRLPYSRS